MTSTEHHDRTAIETRLVAALAAGAESVTTTAPAEPPRATPAGAARVRLLRTRRGVAALAVTAVVAGAAGAAAAAIPGEDTRAPERGTPVEAPSAGAGVGRPGPEQLDIDGDGEVDRVQVTGRTVRVRLTRSGVTDRTRLKRDGRLVALEPTGEGDGVIAVVSEGPIGRAERIGLYVLGKGGFIDPRDADPDQLVVRLDRLSRLRIHVSVGRSGR